MWTAETLEAKEVESLRSHLALAPILRSAIGQEAGIRTRTVSFTGRDAAVTPQS